MSQSLESFLRDGGFMSENAAFDEDGSGQWMENDTFESQEWPHGEEVERAGLQTFASPYDIQEMQYKQSPRDNLTGAQLHQRSPDEDQNTLKLSKNSNNLSPQVRMQQLCSWPF